MYARLSRRGLEVLDSFLTGSYRRSTMIAPLKEADVDVFVVLDAKCYSPMAQRFSILAAWLLILVMEACADVGELRGERAAAIEGARLDARITEVRRQLVTLRDKGANVASDVHYRNWRARSGKRAMSRGDFINEFDRLRDELAEMIGRVRKLDDRYFGIGIVGDNEVVQAASRRR
jgi:hypothetical protein